ncbi:MAG TPA: (2Fe-2S)-binding protein [Pirellulales bacterium]|nr:(2Fe-2S)-binding protein [Pirellulales bacterium]
MSTVKELYVNGQTLRVDADAERTLLSVLRDDLDLTGTKYGCGEGQCGACTVLVDGVPTRSCITAVGEIGEGKIATVESLDRDGRLHPLQQAFLDQDALQCGYCTPGMMMSGVALLQANSSPQEADLLHAMNGNICRCGTYQRIVAAIRQVARSVQEARP